MSRVGNAPVNIPNGVNIEMGQNSITVSGPKGGLTMPILTQVKIEKEENQLIVKRKAEDRFSKSAHGLTRSLLNNMVKGVTEGWTKNLEMVGVGYRAQGGGETLTLSVGYSHPVIVKAPAGITFAVADNTKISVSGIDKTLVGQVSANVRAVRPPEVYKGKGIRYQGEYVRRKAGKAGKAAGGK
jgi:large subunit ribosomal protein L6